MKMAEIKELAKSLKIKTTKMGKIELIRAIQEKEGNVPCFQTGIINCGQYDCCWRDDCQNN